MAVRVELAGRVRVVVDDQVVEDLGGTTTQRVLAVLALAGGPVSRDELGDAVWGESLPRTWETALRGAVSKLRRAVGTTDPTAAELVRTAFGAYQLDPAVTVDVVAATARVERAERVLADDPATAAAVAGEAAAVLARPVLAGLDGEWVDRVRARLVPIRVRADLVRSAAANAIGDHVTAVDAARAAVASDPYAEVAHRRLMTALAAAGDRAAALAAYRQCRELLAAELGVEPSPDTDEVRRTVLADPPPRHGLVLPTRLPVSLGHDVPLAGRAALLAHVLDEWRGGGDGCVLVGPAGIGKSRLAAEVARAAHEAGAAVVHARIEPDDLGGLGSFAELLGQLDVAWPPPDIASAATVLLDRAVLAGAAVDALRAAATQRPIVVVIDDLHWADRSTAAILEHVVTAEISDLFVLATARDEWLEPSPAGSAELIDRLTVIAVPVLDRDGVVELVASWTGHLPGHDVLAAIVERTAGNPFYVLAVLEDLTRRGGDLSRGLDVPRDVLAGVPASVRGIVDAALDRIGPQGRDFADAAAVLGDEFRAATAAAIADVDASVAIVQRLVNGRLVARSPQDPRRLRWVHALVREAVLAGVDPARRRALHRRAVDVLVAEPDDTPAVLLRHLLAAAERTDAARIADLAAAVAGDLTERGRGDEATALLADVLTTIAEAPGAVRAPLLMALAMAELSMDHVVEGRRHLREAADLAVLAGDASFLDSWWSAVSSRAVAGTDDGMVAAVERVLELTVDDPRRRATALGWLTLELAVGPEMGRAYAVACEALAVARRLGDESLLRRIVHTWHLAARVEVPAAARRAVIEKTMAFPRPDGKRAADLLGWVTLAGDCLQLGDAEAASRAVDAAMAGASGLDATHLRWIALRSDVMLATKDGRLEHAESVAEQAAAMAAAMPWPDASSIQVIQHILLRYHQRRLAEVQPFMAAVAAATPEQIGVLITLAFIETELGHEHGPAAVDDVVTILASLTTAAAWLGMMTVVLESMTKVAHPRTAEVAATLVPWSGEHAVITALGYFGAIDRVLGLAAAACGDRAPARRLLQRAIDQHEAIGSRPYAERTRRELAALD